MERRAVSGIMLTLLFIGMLTFAFNVQPVKAYWIWTETIYIRADGSVEPDATPISSVDNITYTLTDDILGYLPNASSAVVVERDNIIFDGAGHILAGTRSETGIELSDRINVTIRNTKITTFSTGIRLESSSNNTISGNNITNNVQEGIWLESSSNNSIAGNSITNNVYDGIRLWLSSDNTISGNNICDGITLSVSSNNTVSGNNITNNIYYGIYLYKSSNNKFYHNNFINNTQQVHRDVAVYDNFWDDGYPSGGNYWSDYTGVDNYSGPHQNQTGSDCIGDRPYIIAKPYIIDQPIQDNYPLMNPWMVPNHPTANFTCSPLHPFINETVTFDASTSVLGWNGTHNVPIANYTWDFGDGTTATTNNPVIYHAYTAAGTYTVNLIVTAPDAVPKTHSIPKTITIAVPPPGTAIPWTWIAVGVVVAVIIIAAAYMLTRKKQHNN